MGTNNDSDFSKLPTEELNLRIKETLYKLEHLHLFDSNREALNAKYSLLKAEKANRVIVGYTTQGHPLTKGDYNTRLEKAEKQIASGDFLTQDAMEKESENW